MNHWKVVMAILVAVLIFFPSLDAGAKGKDKVPMTVSKRCMNCHKEYKEMKGILAGNFSSRSNKAKSIQMKINKRMEVVKFTKQTEIQNVPSIKSLKGTIPIRVHYKEVGKDLVATKIVAKPKMKVPDEQLMSAEELAKLVAMGPEKGGYTLIDSRPGIKFKEGHIPTSMSIPFPKMKKSKDKLPKDKNRLLIFYCEGMR